MNAKLTNEYHLAGTIGGDLHEWWWSQSSALQAIAMGLIQSRYVVIDHFLPKTEALKLHEEISYARSQGLLKENGRLGGGRAGTNSSFVHENVRGDILGWFDGNESCWDVLERTIAKMSSLVFELKAFLPEIKGVNSRSKAMVTCYPGAQSSGEGARYSRHIDNANQNGRKLTAILYANPGWEPGDGGEFRLHPPVSGARRGGEAAAGSGAEAGGWVDVAPRSNRLLLFWSDCRCPHEVRPVAGRRDRYAVTAWFLDGAERAAAAAAAATAAVAAAAAAGPGGEGSSAAAAAAAAAGREGRAAAAAGCAAGAAFLAEEERLARESAGYGGRGEEEEQLPAEERAKERDQRRGSAEGGGPSGVGGAGDRQGEEGVGEGKKRSGALSSKTNEGRSEEELFLKGPKEEGRQSGKYGNSRQLLTEGSAVSFSPQLLELKLGDGEGNRPHGLEEGIQQKVTAVFLIHPPSVKPSDIDMRVDGSALSLSLHGGVDHQNIIQEEGSPSSKNLFRFPFDVDELSVIATFKKKTHQLIVEAVQK